RRLADGDRTIPEIVAALYKTVDIRLHGAAGLSVLAHLEDLVARGVVACDGPPTLATTYTAA
ncbi:MAG: MBL fold metallo-hydrolase, partial [Aurantimonas sp.]|nr:MBL fold metallo-hydrolase [Aurantimonas sp.]